MRLHTSFKSSLKDLIDSLLVHAFLEEWLHAHDLRVKVSSERGELKYIRNVERIRGELCDGKLLLLSTNQLVSKRSVILGPDLVFKAFKHIFDVDAISV
jgi:hypothetical protein